jgi:hypothetical protein
MDDGALLSGASLSTSRVFSSSFTDICLEKAIHT